MSLVRREMTRAVVAGDFRGFFGLVGRTTEFQDVTRVVISLLAGQEDIISRPRE
jgi:hypothetical protein